MATSPRGVIGGRELIRRLGDGDRIVRGRAARALWERSAAERRPGRGDPRAIGPLLDLADDPVKNVRGHAVSALWAIARAARGRAVRERLVQGLADPRPRVRAAAAGAYTGLRNDPFRPLVPLLNDLVAEVRGRPPPPSPSGPGRPSVAPGAVWSAGCWSPSCARSTIPIPASGRGRASSPATAARCRG